MSEKRLVNIGEGRIIEMTEGEGKKPSPKSRKPRAKKPGSKKGKRKKSQNTWGIKQPGKHRGKHPGIKLRLSLVPGYREWWNHRQRQNSEYMIGSRSRLGVPDGMRKTEALKAWAEARRKAQIHMANLKNAGLLPDDEIVQKATQATLEILEGPMNQDMKLKAARQLLDFYKPKPASKSEVTVNAAEAWLASLAEMEPRGDE